jgi:hypothetical protein
MLGRYLGDLGFEKRKSNIIFWFFGTKEEAAEKLKRFEKIDF